MIDRRRIPCLALVAALAVVAAHADQEDEVHLCRNADGEVVLQNDPCPEPPTADAPAAPPKAVPAKPRPPKGPPPNAAPLPPPPPEPETRAGRRSTGPSWKIVRPSGSTRATRRPGDGKRTFPTHAGGTGAEEAPGFSSPERTWLTFLAALERGDADGAGACLTPEARGRLAGDASRSVPVEALRELIGTFTRVESAGDAGSAWAIYGVRRNQRPKWIFFEQTRPGDWRISGI